MSKRTAFWFGLAVVFLMALLPRLIYPVSRPMQWYDRSVAFWDAVMSGDLEGTYQKYHPGVTTMWVAGAGLRLYATWQGWPVEMLQDSDQIPADAWAWLLGSGVAALSLVIAACIVISYILLSHLLDWREAFVGGCLLALDPFHIAQSKVLHLDALLASLMLVSALMLLCYWVHQRRRYLILSGVFAGLSFLTKSPSVFLIPYAALIMLLYYFVDKYSGRAWRQGLIAIAGDLMIWGAIFGLTFFLCWPAVWVIPGKVFSEIVHFVRFQVQTVHYQPDFFAGRIISEDPGFLYYIAVLVWKMTLITFPLALVGIVLMLCGCGSRKERKTAWGMLIYAIAFFVMMSLGAKKRIRYVLPIFLALDVLAAWSLIQLARLLAQRYQKGRRFSSFVVVVLLIIQMGTVLRHHPYYGTHYNLLLGGPWAAQHVLPIGGQGEGLDLAAHFLNGYPDAQEMKVGVQSRSYQQFRRYFAGYTQGIHETGADYWIFAVNSNQRTLEMDLWEDKWRFCKQTAPLKTITFDGVPYVWICRAYAHAPQVFDIDYPLDVQLGEHIYLLGYRLDELDLSDRELRIVFFWQSDGRLTEDYQVFVHLLDAEGQLVAQHDGTPGQGDRPTPGWRNTEIVPDEHLLPIDPDMPDGDYTLVVGMYDWVTMARLPIFGSTGERLPDDVIVLQGIQLQR